MNWSRFKYITLPKIWWWMGYGAYDNLASFWHLYVNRKPPLWPDADPTQCERFFCAYCGKNGPTLTWRERIPDSQMEEVLEEGMGDIDGEFLGFTDVYEHLAAIIPKHWTILDLGCGYAPQAWIFADHKKYVGVDLYGETVFKAPNSIFFKRTSIKEFIEKHLDEYDLDTTFAICSFVPPWGADNASLVRRTFKNCFVYYPSGVEDPMLAYKSTPNKGAI